MEWTLWEALLPELRHQEPPMARVSNVTDPLILVRHGETEWSRTGRHTGRTDIALTDRGRNEASLVAPTLAGWNFAHVFSSPLSRALDTAKLATNDGDIIVDDIFMEWDYGPYEGRTNAEIQEAEPGWSKWDSDIDGGESAHDVGVRCDQAIEQLVAASSDGPVLLFAHGHFLAILIARWLGFDATAGKRFIMQTATVSQLGAKRSDHVLKTLNHRCGQVLAP